MNPYARIGICLVLSVALFACSPDESAVEQEMLIEEAASVIEQQTPASIAVSDTRRPDTDRLRDAGSRPAAVLDFLQVEPGMTVLDLYSGGGYYTEILSYLVGDEGLVVAQNNRAYLQFAKDELTGRFREGRLENVERLTAENNDLTLEPGRFDTVLLILSYHDIYYVDEASGWNKINGAKLLAELYNGLRPGGVLGIVDHAAVVGAPVETGSTLHRLDPEVIKREVLSAGFGLEAESHILRNSDDDGSRSAFDPEIRGRTDRVLLRFRKPY